MSYGEPTVFIVDDDAGMRTALVRLLKSVEMQAEVYASAEEFLDGFDPSRTGCLLLDVRMPGMDGLALQQRLKDDGNNLPIVFLTGHADVPMAVQAMEAGAVGFIEKPFREQVLLDAVRRALEKGEQVRRSREQIEMTRGLLATLTAREREVLDLVMQGKPSKEIGQQLNLSHKTVDFHRSRLMEKLQVANVVSLVRKVMAAEAGTNGPPDDSNGDD